MRIEKTTFVVAALTALAAGPALAAEGPRYTYADVGYFDVDLDDIGDGDGFTLGGSYAFLDNWHGFANYSDADIDADGGEGSGDLQQIAVGIGFNHDITDSTDLVFRASYLDLDIEGFDENGFGLSAGVRSMVLPTLEVNASVDYSDIDDFDNTALSIGGVWNFTEMFALTAGASFGSDANQFGVGLRAYFGSR